MRVRAFQHQARRRVRSSSRAVPAVRHPSSAALVFLRGRDAAHLGWRNAAARANDPLERLTRGLDTCTPRGLDRRFRRAIAFLQQVDLEIGRVLKQVVDRKLYQELGFESFEHYVTERLDLSAIAMMRLADRPAGTRLMTEHESGDELYVVLSGRIRCWVDRNGLTEEFEISERGSIVGEVAFFDEDSERAANAEVVEDARLMRRYPWTGARVLHNLNQFQAKRLADRNP